VRRRATGRHAPREQDSRHGRAGEEPRRHAWFT
jgi:hypothetical protein